MERERDKETIDKVIFPLLLNLSFSSFLIYFLHYYCKTMPQSRSSMSHAESANHSAAYTYKTHTQQREFISRERACTEKRERHSERSGKATNGVRKERKLKSNSFIFAFSLSRLPIESFSTQFFRFILSPVSVFSFSNFSFSCITQSNFISSDFNAFLLLTDTVYDWMVDLFHGF